MPKKAQIEEKKFIPNIFAPKILTESQAQVEQNKVQFPNDLGEQHPFDFKLCEDTFKNLGLAKAAVDKHLDFIISPNFTIKSESKEAQKLITDMIKNTGFYTVLRDWLQEALTKGNGFMEIAIDKVNPKFKVVNANSMYVVRDKYGKLEEYRQYTGDFKKDMDIQKLMDRKKIIPFKPNQIAHLPFDRVGDSPYGIGLIYPGLKTLNNLVKAEKDQHMLLTRKANVPIHAKLGSEAEPVSGEDVTAFGQKLIWLNNMHEWATDHRVEFKTVDFGNIGEKLSFILEYDRDMLFYIFQTPAVLMGAGYQNEGIAQVQLDTFERRIQAKQAYAALVISQQIFKPYLQLNGLDAVVEIIWGQPSEESINQRIDKLTALMGNMSLSPALRALVERDMAMTLGYDELDIELLTKPQEAEQKAQEEKEMEAELNQPEMPGSKPSQREGIVNNAWSWNEDYSDMKILEFVNLQEQAGFNLKDFKQAINRQVSKDPFNDLKANTEEQLKEGLLSEINIERLRGVLKEGFRKNQTLRTIQENIKNKVPLKDRYVGEKLILTAEQRPEVIARTETVRLTNEGLVDMYKENGIQRVRWLSSIGPRTCPECEALNGRLFNITELAIGSSQPPLHPGCRCSLIGVSNGGS